MKQNKSILYLLTILLTTLTWGCKSDKYGDSNLKRNVAAFVSDTNQVVAFGYVDVKNIKDKSEVNKITELKKFLENTFRPIEEAVQLKDKIYYAFAGPVQNNGPEVSYAFFNIRNKDSLQNGLELLGFYFTESNTLPGVKFYDDENTAIGFNDHTLIVVSANFDHDPKKLLLDAFQSFKATTVKEDVLSAISSQDDILLATFIDNLFDQYTYLKNVIPAEHQDGFEELLQDGLWTLGIQFNKGHLKANLDISNVNDQFKQIYFLKEDNNEIQQNIGSDTVNLALFLRFDMNRLDSLLHYFGTQQINDFYNSLYLPVLAKGLIKSEGLTGLTNGNIGFVVGNKMNEEALLGLGRYNMNFYIGLGESSQNIIDLIDTLANADQISNLGDGFYQIENESILRLKNNNLLYKSNASSKNDFKTGSIKIKDRDADFGTLPVSMYMNLDDKYYALSHLPKNVSQLLDYAVLQGDNNGFTLKIVTKDKKTNVLKQLLDAYKQDVISRTKNAPVYK